MFYNVTVSCMRDNGDRCRVVVQNLKAEDPEEAREKACDFLSAGFMRTHVEIVEKKKEVRSEIQS